MRIDAAATQPVFGGLCRQLIRFSGFRFNDRISGHHILTSTPDDRPRFDALGVG